MTTESEFCTVIVNSLNVMGIGYKIPDPTSSFNKAILRPFDIIGVLNYNGENLPCYIEAKFSKKIEAFNFKKVQPHQSSYLNAFSEADNSLAWVILGMRMGRGKYYAYIFDWKSVGYLYPEFSIHANKLELLPFNVISKDILSFDNIITLDTLRNIGLTV